jgi:PleD family two-component response regulator
MILAVVDDLMFSSKIRSAAAQLHLPVVFARSSAAAMLEMNKSRPKLVILDLDSPRTDPIGILGTMKHDNALRDIPAIGFVSHVRADLIQAAQDAGAEEVLPRSAFTSRLPEILSRAKTP